MPTGIYIDECVDVGLGEALRLRGIEAGTAADARMLGGQDEEQLLYATARQMAIVTHDGRDFRRLHRRFVGEGRSHSGILVLSPAPLAILALRTAMMVDWLTGTGGFESRFVTWGDLQFRLTQGERILGYSESDVRLALGMPDAAAPGGDHT